MVENMVTPKERVPTELKEEKTSFIICNEDKGWFLLKAETMDEAIAQARNKGREPRYVVEEKLSTMVR